MTNHVSNLDPPIQIPLIPRRTSVMVKKELFKTPILGRAMRLGSLVPVDRGNRDAGIDAVKDAKSVIDQGMNMTIYVEGKRSFDGKLLPFKKGPFYLAMECGVPIIPMTIVGTHYAMPKARFAIKPGAGQSDFPCPDRAQRFRRPRPLMEKVRAAIDSGLPDEYKQGCDHRGTQRSTGENPWPEPLGPPCACSVILWVSCARRGRSQAGAAESPNISATACDRLLERR